MMQIDKEFSLKCTVIVQKCKMPKGNENYIKSEAFIDHICKECQTKGVTLIFYSFKRGLVFL